MKVILFKLPSPGLMRLAALTSYLLEHSPLECLADIYKVQLSCRRDFVERLETVVSLPRILGPDEPQVEYHQLIPVDAGITEESPS